MLIGEKELVERHGWKLLYRPTNRLFDPEDEENLYSMPLSPGSPVSFQLGFRYIVWPNGQQYPFCQIWPARSETRPAWYIAALTNATRYGKTELRLDGRRSAVGEGTLAESLSYLGIVPVNSVWLWKNDGELFESHPWVDSAPKNWGEFRPQDSTDVGIPSPIEFITQSPFATAYVPQRGVFVRATVKEDEPKKVRRIIL